MAEKISILSAKDIARIYSANLGHFVKQNKYK